MSSVAATWKVQRCDQPGKVVAGEALGLGRHLVYDVADQHLARLHPDLVT